MDTERIWNGYNCFEYKKHFYNCIVTLKIRDMPFFLLETKANLDPVVTSIL